MCNISAAALSSRKDDYRRIKKLVKKELNGHLKENLIAGSIEAFKDSVLKAQCKCISSTKKRSGRANESQHC